MRRGPGHPMLTVPAAFSIWCVVRVLAGSREGGCHDVLGARRGAGMSLAQLSLCGAGTGVAEIRALLPGVSVAYRS